MLRPNLFGIPFGLAGLAACWSAAAEAVHAPGSASGVVWALAAAAWLVVLVPYARQIARGRGLRRELADPTFGPFTAVPAMLVMLLGGALAPWSRDAGAAVFVVGLLATLLVGGYLTGQWILEDLQLAQWHPGYFLPTVGGGLIAANVAARLGFGGLASVMFGYGLVCWFVLGSIILARLFSQPMLPVKLRPTLAIELAPPAVAGNAWFAMHGGRLDQVALTLAGYGLLMVIVQVRLAPLYRHVPFGPGSWAFAFSYLQAVTFGLHWIAGTDVPGRTALVWLLLAVSTAGVLLLAALTGRGLVRRTFLPGAGTA
ncbi:SLAC1 family transporter [Microlunatus flavus]|uniref:SLAC1 family transporter n=1 Tax=Microlunatus flavus TaxID=1036181 RepID=UPI00147C4623|nr:TDT family transporter [Microlunatus flavus]